MAEQDLPPCNYLRGWARNKSGVYKKEKRRKKSILNPELVVVWQNEPWTLNPYHLYPELRNPGLNQIMDMFSSAEK
jgi:hypothetical protein